MLLLNFGMLVVGLVALYYGAEWLVAGSGTIALRVGIPPLVVGLTVVAFGTSAPELLVCLVAVFEQTNDISVGNIIGSNIANIALILGCAAVVRPIQVSQSAVKRDYPIMFGMSVLVAILIYIGGELSRIDGAILVCAIVAYLVGSYVSTRRQMRALSLAEDEFELDEELADADPDASSNVGDALKVLGGVLCLAAGAYLLVESAIDIAKFFKVPELVIGISVVALGTSLPELATSLVASYRNESDISVGNVIGSNIFNVGMVLGIVSCIQPLKVGHLARTIDLPVMIALSLLIWPIMRTGFKISRVEGGILVGIYLAYIISLFVRQSVLSAPAM